MGAVSLLMVAGICLATADESDAEYFNVTPVDGYTVKTGGTITYEAPFYYEGSYSSMAVTFTAYLLNSDGDKMTGAVSPSTGTYTSNGTKTITVTAPSSAGTYRLVVDYSGNVTVGTEEIEVSGSSYASVRAVAPIILKAEITNKGNVSLSSLTVSFVVDGKAVPDSETTVKDIAPGETDTATFEWVTDSLSPGKHTYRAVIETSMVDITGLDRESVFYIGHDDYQIATVLVALLFVILVIVLIFVIRKPVKNYGKPKGRR
jgi:hypothetical protein